MAIYTHEEQDGNLIDNSAEYILELAQAYKEIQEEENF